MNKNNFELYTPQNQCALLFKVSSYDHIKSLQNGLIYMKSLDFFSSLKNEDNIALRADSNENTFGILKAGKKENGYSKISIKHGKSESIDLGQNAIITEKFPKPQNTMIFCMGGIGKNLDGLIPSNDKNKFYLRRNFVEFGSHALLIFNTKTFFERINRSLNRIKGIYGSTLFSSGAGFVEYKNLDAYSGHIGLFIKDTKYAWQIEYRFVLGVENELLNNEKAYELDIGDISDITKIIDIESFISNPFCITR